MNFFILWQMTDLITSKAALIIKAIEIATRSKKKGHKMTKSQVES